MTDERGHRTVLRQAADGARGHGHEHEHEHEHEHSHPHDHEPHHDHGAPHVHAADGTAIPLEVAVLAANDRVAAHNRGWFEGRGVIALNFVSSPGAGKTSLLERTIRDLGGAMDVAVVEGDQMTDRDAARIREAGARAIQINTGTGCHLEADMVGEAARALDLRAGSLLCIENVGNLVCPAMFDLGERMKIVVFSVTEGEDKPLKYPHMFRAAEMVLISKADLAPHVDFDEAQCRANIAAVNPAARVLTLSSRSGAGMSAWLDALRAMTAGWTPGAAPRPFAP